MTSKKGGYLGNANLKPAGIGIEFTKDQVKECMKCAQDPIYFIKKFPAKIIVYKIKSYT